MYMSTNQCQWRNTDNLVYDTLGTNSPQSNQKLRHIILFIELKTMCEIHLTTKKYICSNFKMNGIILYLIL